MEDRALKIGITGGIGSGKTTACRIFEQLGIPVYYADERAKQLMAEEPELRSEIIRIFGPAAYQADGQLNRQHIAKQAFNDQALLQQLNAAVHPAVARDSQAWHEQQQKVPYTLKEAALLYESGSDKALDKVIVVSAPEQLRLQRVMQRDRVDEAAVRARMDRQMPQEEKVRRADFVLHNDGKQSLIQQIQRIHQTLQRLRDEI